MLLQKDNNLDNKEAIALKKELEVSFPNLWDEINEEELAESMDYARAYMQFLDKGKTERLFVKEAVAYLEGLGFVALESSDHHAAGAKVYQVVRNKGLVAAIVGTEDGAKGFNIIGAHVDAPRLDLKPQPVYEESELVYFKTHYYGGIKKYQWPAIPLALHGVAFTGDGRQVDISIGEDPKDPVFTITDLLPHLGRDQMNKKATEVISGEELNALISSGAYPAKDLGGRFKLKFLLDLKERYGLLERDLVSAELELVPAGQARDVGFDRSMIGAYAQDDRVCAYTALSALADLNQPRRTSVCLLFDKEEIGSEGNTGAQSRAYEHILQEIFVRTTSGKSQLEFTRMLQKCQMLSADVSAAYDPTFASVYDIRNSAFLGHGLSLVKYVGARGKSGTSDANSEFFSHIVRTFDQHKIPWQAGGLGKVDIGGGGTVAVYLASLGMEVIDCGVPVLSMHAPFEVTSKLDVYYTYLAYKVFYAEV